MSTNYAVKYETARDRVLLELQSLDWVSWKVMRRIGGVRYSARLRELKRLGYKLEDEADPSGDGKRYRLLDLVPTRPAVKLVKIYLPEREVEILILDRSVSDEAKDILAKALRIFRANKHKL